MKSYPGQYTYQWNGRNGDNVQVATVIYLIRLKTPNYIHKGSSFHQVKKGDADFESNAQNEIHC